MAKKSTKKNSTKTFKSVEEYRNSKRYGTKKAKASQSWWSWLFD